MNNIDTQSSFYVKVWDIFIRLFHWLLVAAIITSFLSVRFDRMDIHFISGHVVLALIIFRLFWGLFGSSTALFHKFIKMPSAIFAYVRNPKSEDNQPVIGHSPIAALSVIGMIGIIGLQVLTGLVADDELFNQGPLAQFISTDLSYEATQYHFLNAKFVIALIVLHLVAIATYYFVLKDNLILPMIMGKKKVPNTEKAKTREMKPRSWISGLFFVLLSVAIAYYVFSLCDADACLF